MGPAGGPRVAAALVALALWSGPAFGQFRKVPAGAGAKAASSSPDHHPHNRWKRAEYAAVKPEVEKSAHSFLHDRTKSPLVLPLEVNVALIGFAGDGGYHYKLDPKTLENFLAKSFPEYRPSCLETHQELEITQKLKYNVVHVERGAERMEAVLKKEMVLVKRDPDDPAHNEGGVQYEVEARNVEAFLAEIYEEVFDDGSVHTKDGVHYAVMVMNLDKLRMGPGTGGQNHPDVTEALDRGELTPEQLLEQEGGYTYRYRYDGGGPTATWASSKRFVVVDLSAGPCTYGRDTLHAAGTVSPSSVPRLHQLLSQHSAAPAGAAPEGAGRALAEAAAHRDAIFRGQVSGVVATAVEQLFAPDVRLETLDFAHRVLVPVIVLRNHRRFNPLQPGHDHSIDMAAVRAEVRKLAQPGQEVVVVEGMYSLHEHAHLAMALTKAMRTRSAQHAAADGRFRLRSRTFVDGWVLLEEFRNSADMLASGLLGLQEDPELHRAFFPAKGAGGAGAAAQQGTRVVPVYVMSLHGAADGLLLDMESLVAASSDMVVVLQTAGQAVELPLDFSSEREPRAADASSPTRHILAGLGQALGGLVAPYERYSPLHGHRVENWIWANGYHPFGPFSNSSGFSELARDTARRNSVLSRVDTALREVRATLGAVEAFAGDYLASPVGGEVDYSGAGAGASSWLDRLYSDPQRSLPILPPATVARLERELGEMEEQLVKLGGTLFSHRLESAHVLSSSVLVAVRGFREYVEHELEAARDGLRCCSLHHAVGRHHGAGGWWYLLALGMPCLLLGLLLRGTTVRDLGHYKLPGGSSHRD